MCACVGSFVILTFKGKGKHFSKSRENSVKMLESKYSNLELRSSMSLYVTMVYKVHTMCAVCSKPNLHWCPVGINSGSSL